MESEGPISGKGHVAFLSLGSNVGDTRHHLKAARQALAALGVSVEEAFGVLCDRARGLQRPGLVLEPGGPCAYSI